MIKFIKIYVHGRYVPGCVPDKPEWDILERIFESPVRMPYFYSLSVELHEILEGKRIELDTSDFLGLYPQENTVPKGDPSSYIILKVKNNKIVIEDLERDEIMDLDFFCTLFVCDILLLFFDTLFTIHFCKDFL